MLANAMFYRAEEQIDESSGGKRLKIGPLIIGTRQLFVSFVTALIVFPINWAIACLFKRSRPKVKKSEDSAEEVNSKLSKRDFAKMKLGNKSSKKKTPIQTISESIFENNLNNENTEKRIDAFDQTACSNTFRFPVEFECEDVKNPEENSFSSKIPNLFNIFGKSSQKSQITFPWWTKYFAWTGRK